MRTRGIRRSVIVAASAALAVGGLLAAAQAASATGGGVSRAGLLEPTVVAPTTEPTMIPTEKPPAETSDRGLSVVVGVTENFNLTVNREGSNLTVLISRSDVGMKCTISDVSHGYNDGKPKGAVDESKIVDGSARYIYKYDKVEGKAGMKVTVTITYRCEGDTEDKILSKSFLFNPDDPNKAPVVTIGN